MTKNNKVKVIITTKEDTDHYEQEKRRILDMTYKEEENLIDCLAKEWNLRFGRPIDDVRIKEEFREGNIDIMILRHYFDKEKFPDYNSYRDFYYRKKFWTVEEASVLLLDMNPKKFDLAELHKINIHFVINRYNNYLKLLRDTFDAERVLVKDVINWSDQNRIELPKSMQVFFKTELIDLEEQCRKLETENKEIKAEEESLVNQANELEEKNSSLSSQVQELITEKENLVNEIKALEAKVLNLEKNSSAPHHKTAKCLYKGFIGLLVLKYGRDKILKKFGKNSVGMNPDSKSLIKLSTIKNALDAQGINLDDETIKGMIDQSISYLEEKPK
jgi:hypothetical protein